MATKKINEIKKGDVQELIGIDANGDIKKVELSELSISSGNYIQLTELTHSELKAITDVHHGKLHIIIKSSDGDLVDFELIMNDTTIVQNKSISMENTKIVYCAINEQDMSFTYTIVRCLFNCAPLHLNDDALDQPLEFTASAFEYSATTKEFGEEIEIEIANVFFECIDNIDDSFIVDGFGLGNA